MVLLLLGCEYEDEQGMFSQNCKFVLTIFNMTNVEERTLGKSQERQVQGRK